MTPLAGVCVWNVWIDVKLLSYFVVFNLVAGASGPSYLPDATKLWYDGGRVNWSFTCTCDSFFGLREWHGAKPRTPARLSQSDDYSFIGYLDRYLCASVHFWMLNSGCIISIWALFHLSYLHLGHPEEYVEEDSLLSRTNLILLAWDSVPNRSYDGSFLV